MTPNFDIINLFTLNLIEVYNYTYYTSCAFNTKTTITAWVIDDYDNYMKLRPTKSIKCIFLNNYYNSINILGKYE